MPRYSPPSVGVSSEPCVRHTRRVAFNPLSLFSPARWAIGGYRRYRQARRQVAVLVHGPAAFLIGGASPLTSGFISTLSPAATGIPAVTGTSERPGVGDSISSENPSLYWFMTVTNKSQARDIELTHAYFADAPSERLLTNMPLRTRLKPDETWEGWLNVANLANTSNVEQSGRVLISGKNEPIRSRRNRHVPAIGNVAGPH